MPFQLRLMSSSFRCFGGAWVFVGHSFFDLRMIYGRRPVSLFGVKQRFKFQIETMMSFGVIGDILEAVGEILQLPNQKEMPRMNLCTQLIITRTS